MLNLELPNAKNLPYYVIFVLSTAVASLFVGLESSHKMREEDVARTRRECAEEILKCREELAEINREFHSWLKYQDSLNRKHFLMLEKLRKR